jgi:hypothetical protein
MVIGCIGVWEVVTENGGWRMNGVLMMMSVLDENSRGKSEARLLISELLGDILLKTCSQSSAS